MDDVFSLTATDGEFADLLPLLAIYVAVSALMPGIKCIRSFMWGA